MAEVARPDRKWYYLGGEFRDAVGVRTTDPGDAEFPSDAWFEYSAEVSFQLSESYQSLLDSGSIGDAKLLDLSMFSDPPLPYEIWHGRRVLVCNHSAPSQLRGKHVVAGFRADFWTHLEDKVQMLPKGAARWVDMGVAKVAGGFYQIHQEHVGNLEQLLRFLEDGAGVTLRPVEPRKRLVLMVEFPVGWDHRTGQVKLTGPAGQEIAPLEEGDPPVYEWWYGDRPLESDCHGSQPRGFWRRYHATVCRRLEQAWQNNADFQACRAAVDVDGVRYMIRHITPETPFDHSCTWQGVPLEKQNSITVNYPCFEELDRVTGNCLVQFRKEDSNRRRPARRRMNAEEIARNAARTGEPCCICYSEPGEVTGCAKLHVICGDCLRAGLRSIVGDITVLDNLLCGCFSHLSRGTVTALAERSDAQLREVLAKPPADHMAEMLLEDELKATRRQFDFELDDPIPATLYATKVREWYDKVIRQQIMPNYYVCSHPSCADEVENWMPREVFDAEYRANGRFEWCCPLGHKNTVLPMKDEICEVNRTLLLHPEYYVGSASYDNCPLRRFRLCRGCVEGGVLMLAVHADGCKQWPGGGSAHRHCFCFSCTRTWDSECSHGNVCTDPGIQQVRSRGDRLEIGHVNGQEYLRWLHGLRPEPPPTAFPMEPFEASGAERQRLLGMEDRAALLAESQSGTQ